MKKAFILFGLIALVLFSGCIRSDGGSSPIDDSQKIQVTFQHEEIKQGYFTDLLVNTKNIYKDPILILSVESDGNQPIRESSKRSSFGEVRKSGDIAEFNVVAQIESAASGAYFYSGLVLPGEEKTITTRLKFLEDQNIKRTVKLKYLVLNQAALNSLYIEGQDSGASITYVHPKSVKDLESYSGDILIFESDMGNLKEELEPVKFESKITLLGQSYSEVENIVKSTIIEDYTFSIILDGWVTKIKDKDAIQLLRIYLDNGQKVQEFNVFNNVQLGIIDLIDDLENLVVYDYVNESCTLDLQKRYGAVEATKYHDGAYEIQIPKSDVLELFNCVNNLEGHRLSIESIVNEKSMVLR